MQLARLIKSAGMVLVDAVNNGQSAVETVLRDKPDLVLMDIRMPKMDGLEATRQILASYSVCIVMLTAFSDDDIRARARNLGASGYIVKPVNSLTLITGLEASYLEYIKGNVKPET